MCGALATIKRLRSVPYYTFVWAAPEDKVNLAGITQRTQPIRLWFQGERPGFSSSTTLSPRGIRLKDRKRIEAVLISYCISFTIRFGHFSE